MDNPYVQGLYQNRKEFNNLIFSKLDLVSKTHPEWVNMFERKTQ